MATAKSFGQNNDTAKGCFSEAMRDGDNVSFTQNGMDRLVIHYLLRTTLHGHRDNTAWFFYHLLSKGKTTAKLEAHSGYKTVKLTQK